jgi:hypothetical protein
MSGLQGQVIISSSKPTGGSGDAVTKAYILIPQNSSGTTMAGGGQVVQTISVSAGGQAILSTTPAINPIQMIINQMTSNVRDGFSPSLVGHISADLLDQDLPYLCEWSGCGYRFIKYQQVSDLRALLKHGF